MGNDETERFFGERLAWKDQERREPNVGPGPAQIRRISGFMNSKTDGENAALLSKL